MFLFCVLIWASCSFWQVHFSSSLFISPLLTNRCTIRCIIEAWALIRQHSTRLNMGELLGFLYESCQELNLIKELLKLPLGLSEQVGGIEQRWHIHCFFDPFENPQFVALEKIHSCFCFQIIKLVPELFLFFFQECFEKFLQGTGGLHNRELLMVHYLQQANYIPALQLNHSLRMNQVVCLMFACSQIHFHLVSFAWFFTTRVLAQDISTQCSFRLLLLISACSLQPFSRMRESQNSKSGTTPGTRYWTSTAKFCPEFRENLPWSEPNPTSIHPPYTEKVGGRAELDFC